jgi:hypothetical protein
MKLELASMFVVVTGATNTVVIGIEVSKMTVGRETVIPTPDGAAFP